MLDAGLIVEINGSSLVSRVDDEFFIPRNVAHRVSGGVAGGRFIEIAFGRFDEDDIERLEDVYGRS